VIIREHVVPECWNHWQFQECKAISILDGLVFNHWALTSAGNSYSWRWRQWYPSKCR